MKKMFVKISSCCAVCLLSALMAVPCFATTEEEPADQPTVEICRQDCLVVKEECVTVCDKESECEQQCMVDLEGCTEACKDIQ